MPDRPTVWIVDDSTFSLRLLLKQFTDAGADARGFESGRQAAAALVQNKPSLVVLDADMPELDGVGTAQRFGEFGFEGPRIICTASPEHLDKEACVAAGVTEIYPKPLDKDQVQSILSLLEA